MSADAGTTPDKGSPLDSVTAPRERADSETFTLDGDLITATKPKVAVLAVMDTPASAEPSLQVQAVGVWMPHVFDDESNKLLSGRLDDPEDDLDIPDLTALGHRLLEHWSPRPTGNPRGSRGRSRQSGRGSTARSR